MEQMPICSLPIPTVHGRQVGTKAGRLSMSRREDMFPVPSFSIPQCGRLALDLPAHFAANPLS
jgi:hypothetical protein